MGLYTAVKTLAEEQGKTVYRIEHDLGIGNGTIGRWDSSMPRADTLQKVANYLDVTISFILDQSKEEK